MAAATTAAAAAARAGVNMFQVGSPAAWTPPEDTSAFSGVPVQQPLPKLHQLVIRQDLAGVTEHLNQTGFRDINLQDDRGRTPLHLACVLKNADIVRQLLRRGAFVHAAGVQTQATPLHCACVKGNYEVAKILIKYGASLDAPTVDGITPLAMLPRTVESKKFAKAVMQPLPLPKLGKKEKELLQAIATNDELGVIELIHAGADINACDPSDQMTPLMLSAKQSRADTVYTQGNENLVRLFLFHCADVHRQDKDKNTALHWACTRGDLNVVQLLVEFDSAVNLPEKGGWYTPFHWAVLKNNIEVAMYLATECNANPTLPDKEGFTPLHTACRPWKRTYTVRAGAVETVLALLSIPGINPNAADAYGVRPIHVAVRRGDVAIVECLLKSKVVDPAAATVTFSTPLHDACIEPNPEIARLLFQYGSDEVDANVRTYTGATPLHVLVSALDEKRSRRGMANLLSMIQILGEHNADPNLRNEMDRTPLLLIDVNNASQEGTLEHVVARALVAAGADLGISFRLGLAACTTPRDRDKLKALIELLRERHEQDVRLPPGWTRENSHQDGLGPRFVDRNNNPGVPPTMFMTANDSRLVPLMPLKDEPTTQASQSSLADFACPLCMELLYKPVTIDCGHNVCQPCLQESLQFHSNCPICRKPFKKPTGPPSINVMLAAVLERTFPERYAARHSDFLASMQA